MPLGDDLVGLVPISIAIVLCFLGLTALFINYVEKVELNDMHRVALNVLEREVYKHGGVFDRSKLDNENYFNTGSAEFEIQFHIEDLESGWNKSYGSGENFSVIVSSPVLIDYGDHMNSSKLYVRLKSK